MKKRTVLRSAAALTLAIVMLLALALPALAANDGSITINPNGQAGLGDDNRFTAYQIFKGDVNKDNTEELDNLVWGDGVEGGSLVSAMKQSRLSIDGSTFGTVFTTAWEDWNKNYHEEMDVAEFVAQWLGQHRDKPAYAEEFARLAAKNTKGDGEKSSLSGSDWVINNLEPGYYLVKDNYVSAQGHTEKDGSVSSYILQVVGQVNVDLKATIPIVEKKIVSGGQLVDGILTETETPVTYRLIGTVSENIGEYDTYEYKFTDTISAGLTVTPDQLRALKVTYSNTSGTTSATFTEGSGNDYTVSISPGATEAGEHVLTVTFSNLKKSLESRVTGIDLSKTDLVKNINIIVEYTAQLNKNAVIGSGGNPNNVVLEYSNNPYSVGKGETIPDVVNTYTLALRIVKKGADNANLRNAKFKLMQGDSGSGDPNAASAKFAKFTQGTGEAGSGLGSGQETYQEISSWVEGIGNGDTLTTDANGEFNIHGLSAGNYILVETEAPEGYETMKPIQFKIEGTVDSTSGALTKAELSTNEETRQDVHFNNGDLSAHNGQLTLTNFKSPILPHTGGIGAGIVYLVSALAVVTGAAIVYLATRKRGRGRHEQSR